MEKSDIIYAILLTLVLFSILCGGSIGDYLVDPVKASPEVSLLYLVWTNETLNGVTTVTSRAYPLKQVKNFGVWIKGTSVAGTPEYTLGYEVSYDAVPGNFEEPDRALKIFGDNTAAGLTDTTINDENIHQDAFSPPCSGWIRFILNGVGTNPVDSIITCRMTIQ